MKKENKNPRNEKGLPHGHWEAYYINGNIVYKRNFINGERIGFWESYNPSGELKFKRYYIL